MEAIMLAHQLWDGMTAEQQQEFRENPGLPFWKEEAAAQLKGSGYSCTVGDVLNSLYMIANE